jgi:hypothetical protein
MTTDPKAEKAPKTAPHEMWVYGPNDEPLMLAEGDEIPAGYKDHLSDAKPNKE